MKRLTVYQAVKELLDGATQQERFEALRAAMEANRYEFNEHLRALSKHAKITEHGVEWNRRDNYDLYGPMTLLSCIESCLDEEPAKAVS